MYILKNGEPKIELQSLVILYTQASMGISQSLTFSLDDLFPIKNK